MASSFPDPFQMWRDALTKFENDTNKLTTGAMQSSPEVMRSLNQFASMNMGIQQILEKALDGYLHRINLPNRKDVADLAEALQRVEAKLDQALGHSRAGGNAPAAVAASPRPARTRKPPTAAAAPVKAPAPVPAPKKRATRSAAKKG